jgi:hypothetical protein
MKKNILTIAIFLSTVIGVMGENISTRTKHRKAQTVKSKIPIIAFVGVTQAFTSVTRYQEMSNAGIMESYVPFSDVNAMQQALDVAAKTKIKLFISCPELIRDPENTVKRFMNHPALAGYYVQDEPGMGNFAGLASMVKRINAVDNKHVCYVNLLPNYASNSQLGANYQQYLDRFINTVPVQMLSFDHYPIIGKAKTSIRAEWYKNLQMVSDASRKSNKPFWAFALSTAFSPYPVSTLASLRLQVYSDLAYGAQAIEYFTYWTLNDPATGFNTAPISFKGEKTEVYSRLQQVNKEIQGLANVFLGARVISVAHTGQLPAGTKPLGILPAPIKSLKTDGIGAVVSVLKNGAQSYLVVVNHDFTANMNLTISFGKGVSKVLKDGSSVLQRSNISQVSVEPGDVAIYKWSNK